MAKSWDNVREELERRRKALVDFSCDDSTSLKPVERMRIQSLLERWESPGRPTDIAALLKQFCVSAFSYAPLRRFLADFIGDLPTRNTIARALSLAFGDDGFLVESNWLPEGLGSLAAAIQERERFDLLRRQFKPRIISVLRTASAKMETELADGLVDFYGKVSNVTAPCDMWNLVNAFSKPIRHVGPALICDFFKEIGFTRYVKVDHHFARGFPALLASEGSCRLNPRRSFVLSQEIADAIGMTPFHLDAILYLWGRYGPKGSIQ